MNRQSIFVYPGIVLFAVLFFLPGLGSVNLFDWDEINFAESAREMIVTGDYITVQINYAPFWEKPPLFFWMQVLSMKLFGINAFAARFPNFICGIVSLMMLYYLGKRIYNHRFGVLWVLTYGAAILPFFYFKSGIIDPWFNLFIVMGLAWLVFYFDPAQKKKQALNVSLSALFFGLAVLTKGPVAVLVLLFCLLIFLIIKRFRVPIRFAHAALFAAVLIVVGGTWFLLQILNGNISILKDFIEYQVRLFSTGDAGHSGFFGYHFVVVFFGVFPASVLFLKSFTRKAENTELQKLFRQWMLIMFWVVIILFSIVRTKILHYSSLTYFPMTFLAAWVWEKWIDRKIEISRWQVILILIIALMYAGVTIGIPVLANNADWVIERNFSFLDPFTLGALTAQVHWSRFDWVVGLFLMVGVAYASIQIIKRETKGMLILHIISVLFISATLYIFTSRIEAYSQRAAIKFYESLKDEDVYVNTLGFKSYAHLFYTEKMPPDNPESDNMDWLMSDELDKDAYFVIKVNKRDAYLERYPELEVLYEKNGFVFTVRRAVEKNDQ
ncbi:MAG TPA: glycosyltransferase family 39 protein [Bacteroidaceae bacterium]|nr:glycosyltransferase family 39 protein [Bacteroidaceae bacterium]